MLPLLFLMPIVQLLVLAHAADYEVRNLKLHVVDLDRSTAASRLIGKFQASDHFILTRVTRSARRAHFDLESDAADLVLEIPVNFERRLLREEKADLLIAIDAINGVKAGLTNAYTNAIINDFNRAYRREHLPAGAPGPPLEAVASNWYNKELEYDNFMVPGILVILVSLIALFLSGINIVKEKEIGTIEQLNVTPIRKVHFIIGKLLPFWLIGMVDLALGLAIGDLVFDIPMVGSLWLIFAFASIYLLALLGIGLFVSTLADTQQQAMFISWFFVIIFVLMSGLFTPIESMPGWAKQLTLFNPIAYFVEVIRSVLLRGSGWADIRQHFLIMGLFSIVINALAVWNYRKTNA